MHEQSDRDAGEQDSQRGRRGRALPHDAEQEDGRKGHGNVRRKRLEILEDTAAQYADERGKEHAENHQDQRGDRSDFDELLFRRFGIDPFLIDVEREQGRDRIEERRDRRHDRRQNADQDQAAQPRLNKLPNHDWKDVVDRLVAKVEARVEHGDRAAAHAGEDFDKRTKRDAEPCGDEPDSGVPFSSGAETALDKSLVRARIVEVDAEDGQRHGVPWDDRIVGRLHEVEPARRGGDHVAPAVRQSVVRKVHEEEARDEDQRELDRRRIRRRTHPAVHRVEPRNDPDEKDPCPDIQAEDDFEEFRAPVKDDRQVHEDVRQDEDDGKDVLTSGVEPPAQVLRHCRYPVAHIDRQKDKDQERIDDKDDEVPVRHRQPDLVRHPVLTDKLLGVHPGRNERRRNDPPRKRPFSNEETPGVLASPATLKDANA